MATHRTDRDSLLVDTTVAEAMSPGVVMCGAETRLPVVAAAMAGQGIHAIVVPSPHGGPALTISDLDLLRAELGDTGEQTAGDVALEPMATVVPSATVQDATARMATLDVAHLLVGEAASRSGPTASSRASTSSPCSAAAIPRLTRDGALRAGAAAR